MPRCRSLYRGPATPNCLLAFLLVSLANVNGQSDGSQLRTTRAKELLDCINSDFKLIATSWNGSIMFDTPANLKLEKIWWTPRVPRFNFTIITQLSLDRFPVLLNQCSTYNGPVSAAVFLALVQAPTKRPAPGKPILLESLSQSNKERITEAAEHLEAVFQKMEAEDGCQLDLMLFWEVFDSDAAVMLYPVNSLRNYARMQVRTELLSAIDVDMMISASLAAQLSDPAEFATIRRHALDQKAVVLPAFEPTRVGPVGRELAAKSVEGNKSTLAYLYKNKFMMQFKLKVFSRGHTPTDYARWFNASEYYPVRYRHMYEPWFITYWGGLPWFDVRFRGYGMNKIAHVASLNLYNFTFLVNHATWIVHRPHADTSVRKVVAREASNVNKLNMKLADNSLYKKVSKLFGQVKREMIGGTYAARLDQRMVKCFATLPWLQPMPQMTPTPLGPHTFVT